MKALVNSFYFILLCEASTALVVLAPFSPSIAASETEKPKSTLEFSTKEGSQTDGNKGQETRIFGVCFTEEQQERTFEANVPGEVQLDITASRCSIKPERKISGLKIRFFQNRKFVYEVQSDETPSAGIEFVLPLGGSHPSSK